MERESGKQGGGAAAVVIPAVAADPAERRCPRITPIAALFPVAT